MTAKRSGGGLAAKSGAVINGRGGRWLAGQGLTEQQQAFVRAYLANGMQQGAAAREAGYAHPAEDGWRLMQNAAVLAAIDSGHKRGAVRWRDIGLRALERIATDPTVPPGCALDAAERLIAHGDRWLGQETGQGGDVPDRPRGSGPAAPSPEVARLLLLIGRAKEETAGDSVTINGQAVDIQEQSD